MIFVNENYLESHKYPKATFRGKILNYNQNTGQDFETEIEGVITIHGKEKTVSTGGIDSPPQMAQQYANLLRLPAKGKPRS